MQISVLPLAYWWISPPSRSRGGHERPTVEWLVARRFPNPIPTSRRSRSRAAGRVALHRALDRSRSHRGPSRLISCVEQSAKGALCEVSGGHISEQPVCNPGTDGETSIRTAAVPSGATPRGGRTWLQRLDFCGSERKKPHSTIARGAGRLHRPRIPRRPTKTTEERRRCLTPEFTSALGAPG